MRVLRPAFVVTIAAASVACASQPAPQPTEPTRNPPAQPAPQPVEPHRNPPEPTCPPRGQITAGAPCAPNGMDCYLPSGGCQPPGFRCENGAWLQLPQPTCNPPPPPSP